MFTKRDIFTFVELLLGKSFLKFSKNQTLKVEFFLNGKVQLDPSIKGDTYETIEGIL